MISAYSLSIRGRDHQKCDKPCHDYSLIKEISSSWKIAIVADGVGSCKHAEVASKIAAETLADLIVKQFPSFSDDQNTYKSVLWASMNGAANAIESYVEANDPGNIMEYQTTLAVAIMSKKNLYYGNAGDSGIIALDEAGLYHVLCGKQNDAEGRVYSMPNHRNFDIGVVDFIPIAVICMTDGVLDSVVPEVLRKHEYKVNVPFANLFIEYALRLDPTQEEIEAEKCKQHVVSYLSSKECENMTDDLSAAVLVRTDSYLLPSDIKWNAPEIDYYALKWGECSIYTLLKTRIETFIEYVIEMNPNSDEKQIKGIAQKYIDGCDDEFIETIIRRRIDSKSSMDGYDSQTESITKEEETEKPIRFLKGSRGLKGLFDFKI